MITMASTGLTPSNNAGIIGGFSLKRFRISSSDLRALTDVQSFFTVGANVEEKVDEYLNLLKTVKNQINVPEINFTADMGFRSNGGVTQYYYDSSSTTNIRTILDNATTFEEGYSYFIEIDANGAPIYFNSSQITVAVGSPMLVSHKEGYFPAVDNTYTIYFDQETKLITSFGTGSPKDKKVKITMSFVWIGDDALIKKFDNGVVLFAKPDDAGQYSGFGFWMDDSMIKQRKKWGPESEVGWFRSRIGCINNTVGPEVGTTQIYHPQPNNASKPDLDVNVVMDSTFYEEPEVYSRL